MIHALAQFVLKRLRLYATYSLHVKGYLREVGWFRSFEEERSVDAQGNPIPFITYPAIDFLTRRVNKNWSVFEYGSGASTLWWAGRVREVFACEHHQGWFARVKAQAPANVTLFHVPLEYGGAYCRKILDFPNRFDIVVIDGRDRGRCARNAVQALNPGGVIVWDNSERSYYRDAQNDLLGQGFRKIEFVGMAPIANETSETAIFYRPGNCLGI
jgi:hypothetical protein